MRKRTLRLLLLILGIPALVLAQGGQTAGVGGASAGAPGVPSGACSPFQLYVNTSNGFLYTCNGGTWFLAGGGASVAFSAVTAGTNATALVVGTGGTLVATGTGAITATSVIAPGDPADAGRVRMLNLDCLNWEADAAGTDFGLCGNATEQIVASASVIGSNDGGKDLGSVAGGFGTLFAYAHQQPNAADPADVGLLRMDNAANGPCWESSPAGDDVCWFLNSGELLIATIDTPASGQGIGWGTASGGATGRSHLTHQHQVMEGGTMDGNEVDIDFGDPTADIANTWPSVNGTVSIISDCADASAPAACGAATTGSVIIPDGATTVTINSTAVAAGSRFFLQFDPTLGTRLGVTCNTTAVGLTPTTRTAGTSFVVTASADPAGANPVCINFRIDNGS